MTNSATDRSLRKLNASWRQYVSRAMDIDEPTFRLAQGSLSLDTSSDLGIFRMSDLVPPGESVFWYDAGSAQSFASAYILLLTALLPETGQTLKQSLGDSLYQSWVFYRTEFYNNHPDNTKTQEQVFEEFSQIHLSPQQASDALVVFKKQAADSNLNQAFDAYSNADCQVKFPNGITQRVYSATAAIAERAIKQGASLKIEFNSSVEERGLTESQIRSSVSSLRPFWPRGNPGALANEVAKLADNPITISGYLNRYATVATTMGCWFTSSEYSRAFNGKGDVTIWDPDSNAGSWDSFFGQPNGALARRVTQILLVSDYQITVTSSAHYSRSDVNKIQTAGFFNWPLFIPPESSSSAIGRAKKPASMSIAKAPMTSELNLNDNGTMTVTHTLANGAIQVWGVAVQEAPSA